MTSLPQESEAGIGPALTNLADLVARHAEQTPEAIALVQPRPTRRTLTWAEFDQLVTGVAAGLAGHDLVAGQRVGLLGVNSIDFVVAYFAALRAGLVVVPINPQGTAIEVATILSDSGARVLLADPGAAGVVDSSVQVLPLTAAGLIDLAAHAEAPVSSPRDRESLAGLLYTAGTSGDPKAVMLTHRALLAHLEHLDQFAEFGDQLVVLAVLPLFHVFGLNAVLGTAIYSGGRTVIIDGFSADLLKIIAEEGVNNLPLAPSALYRLLQQEGVADFLTGVNTVISGAAPLPAALAESFTARTRLPVQQGYGLTEAAPGVTATFGGPLLGAGHVGRPLPGVEVRIGEGSDPSEPGEVWIRGANLFSGYWPDGRGGPDADGWFATGDIGYLVDGELHLVDRARELIIVSGFNVYPAEVEDALLAIDGVQEAAVIGQLHEATGERVIAFVVGDVESQTVLERCADKLARFKRPAEVRVVAELPRGATGKIRKGALRRMLDTPGVSE